MKTQEFAAKWDEHSLFVEPGAKPLTQRQLNLYYYFLFIKNILGRRNIKSVLEIGCGRGTISLYLAKYLGFDLTLLDNVAGAIDQARESFSQYNLKAEFVVGDALVTGLSANSFDAIVSIGLAEHFPPAEVSRLLAEQYRLLKPGGVMISLNIPGKFSVQSLNTVMRFFKKIFGRYQESIRKDYFRNDLTATEFATIAQNVGFKKVEITHVCPFPIWVPVSPRFDRLVTSLRRFHLRLRSLFMSYPYKTNALVAQAHFLVGEKKIE